MASRPAFNISDIAGCRHQIQKIDDIERGGHPKCDMMHARAGAISEGHIMYAALAVHPCCPKPAALLIFGIFCDAKSDIVIKCH